MRSIPSGVDSPASAVIKVGGSLLDWPGLPARLAAYLGGRSRDRLVLVVGGGCAADWVREQDRIHAFGEERAHHLAVRAMELTAHGLATLMDALMPQLRVVEQIEELIPAWGRGLTPILAPRRFLESDDRSPDRLPHSWRVTSDSIAARLALRLGGMELTLLKSATFPAGIDRPTAARLGLVDPEFPRVAAGLDRVLVLNLRQAPAGSAVPLPP